MYKPDMIPANPLSTQPARWQALWRDAVRDPQTLLDLLDLGHLTERVSAEAMAQFPLRVPLGFVARMRRGDADDPLLRQVLPLVAETFIVPGFTPDAVGDLASTIGRASCRARVYQYVSISVVYAALKTQEHQLTKEQTKKPK